MASANLPPGGQDYAHLFRVPVSNLDRVQVAIPLPGPVGDDSVLIKRLVSPDGATQMIVSVYGPMPAELAQWIITELCEGALYTWSVHTLSDPADHIKAGQHG